MKLFNILLIMIFLVFVAIFSSCSGSGESGNSFSSIGLSALVLPEKVSVVAPQGSGGAAKPQGKTGPLMLGAISMSNLPETSDYMSDKVTVYVNERSLESFKSVNEILCMLRQSRYDAMLNKGPYKAQVDKNLCSTNRSDASRAGESSTNQTSGSTMPDYEAWTVNSYRPNAKAPHVVDAWVHGTVYDVDKGRDVPSIILAKVVITEGADTAPPYGLFKANFRALDKETMTERFTGFLNAELDPDHPDKILLRFSTEDKDFYSIEKATLYKNPDGSDGAGSVYSAASNSWASDIKRFNVAYDDNYFLRADHFNPSSSICLDRKNPDVSAWKYGLYNMDGSRVRQNSGFPIKIGSAYGWVGYWGAWFPAGVTVNNGDQVMKHDYATNTDTPYTVVRAGGKLKKHTKNQIKLGDITNIPLIWWDNRNATASPATYIVVWDGGKFYKAAMQNPDGSWQQLPAPPDPLSVFSLSDLPWVELGFWSESLSGSVLVKLPVPTTNPQPGECSANVGSNTFNCTDTANSMTQVIYYAENIVYPNNPNDLAPTNLACFQNCPNVATLTTGTPYRTDIVSYQTTTPSSADYAAYSFNETTMLLYDETTSAVTLTVENTAASWGITSGPLFDPAYLDLLACDWDPGKTCEWKAWSALPVFYTWETGPNEWNMFTGLKDMTGKPVLFDPPLQVEYTHSLGKYAGTKFYLQYAGFGELQGIPGKCVDLDNGTDADCSESSSKPIKWVPEFTIPDVQADGTLTEVTAGATTYIVKALEKEERMKSAPGQCGHLTAIATPYNLPGMKSYTEPVIGTEPIITGAPAVIGGVVQ